MATAAGDDTSASTGDVGVSPIAKDASAAAAAAAPHAAAKSALDAEAPSFAGASSTQAPAQHATPGPKATHSAAAAAGNASISSGPMLEDPQQSFAPFLEEKAQRFVRDEKWYDALNAREHVLRCYLRAFGEQSHEASVQKQLLAALILKAGDETGPAARVSDAPSRLNLAHASASYGRQRAASPAAGGPRVVGDPLVDGNRHKSLLATMFGASPVGDLTFSSRLEYAQLLLSPQSVGPALSEDPSLRHLRARLLIAHATITAKQKRPRSAIPVLTEAMRLLQGLIAAPAAQQAGDDPDAEGGAAGAVAQLSPASQEAARLELCECYLTKSVLLSSSGKHEDALATSMWGLAAILQLEEESWRNFQELRGADPAAPRAKIFHASLQAACHHNVGAEQEHLGLTELALDSYETGFELAVSCFGVSHPMSERLKTCYSELFAALHYKHFVRNGEQRDTARQALKDSEIAVAHLRASYYASERHRAALAEQTKKQTRLLARAGADASAPPQQQQHNVSGVSGTASSTGRTPSRSRSRPSSTKRRSSRPPTAAHRS